MDWSRKDKNCEDNGISALSKWEEFKNNTNQIHYGSLRIWAGEYDDHIETNPNIKKVIWRISTNNIIGLFQQ